ncbi:MAG TPA: hypothetical protein K8W06_01390 [Limosilactobacillus coleohominis]|nr:hypothetical protein [Limosilactobacillus coleohominis]
MEELIWQTDSQTMVSYLMETGYDKGDVTQVVQVLEETKKVLHDATPG